MQQVYIHTHVLHISNLFLVVVILYVVFQATLSWLQAYMCTIQSSIMMRSVIIPKSRVAGGMCFVGDMRKIHICMIKILLTKNEEEATHPYIHVYCIYFYFVRCIHIKYLRNQKKIYYIKREYMRNEASLNFSYFRAYTKFSNNFPYIFFVFPKNL